MTSSAADTTSHCSRGRRALLLYPHPTQHSQFHPVARSRVSLSAFAFATGRSTGHFSTTSHVSWTWEVPKLIRDAEETDGAA